MILFLLSHLGSLQYSRATLSITLQLYQVPCSLVDPVRETKTKDQNHLDKDVAIQEFNLEKARLEVHRFGITGYGKGKERVLEQERAIMLGARVSGCLCLPPPAGLRQRGTPDQGRMRDAGKCLQDKK